MTFAYLCCMSSNSVTMPSKLLPISTEHQQRKCERPSATETETLAVSTATALQQLHLQGIGNVSQAFLWHFVVNFAQQLLAIVHCQDCIPASAYLIFKALIYTTEFLEAPSYFPITCIPISPCSVDIGNSLKDIVTEFEPVQPK